MSAGIQPGNASSAERSIQIALQHSIRQAPWPFAITRGDDHALVYANSAFRRLADFPDGDALGKPIATAFGASEGRALKTILDAAVRDGVASIDSHIEGSTGRARNWKCSVWPVIADDGRVEAVGIEIRDELPADSALEFQRQIAEQMLLGALRERGLAEDAEAARRRAAFLAEAGRMLSQTVDQASTLLALTRLALPTLGAWCIVDILKEGGAIHRLEICHPDPQKQELARQLEARWAPRPEDPFGAPAMLRSARTIAITEDIEDTLAASAHNEENLKILRQLGIGSLLTVPLVARGKLLGAITFVGAQRGVRHSPDDVQLAEDLAGRGALALDNAQVYDLALVLRHTAETANRAKTAFLGAMSHELRTPLNAIGGYIDLLDMGLRGPVTEHQRAAFARVKTNQQHLALLITEILTFARLGSGRVAYIITDLEVCDVLQHAIELVEPLFAEKGIAFEGVSGDKSILANADRERVTQILVNLLSNAIKFTPSGGRISADCAMAGDSVEVRISDTGIGIALERQAEVFEPFIQLKEGLTDREGGVGLGLSISRDLARAMRGDLTVESEVGKGASFILSLPRGGEREEPASAPRQDRRIGRERRRPRDQDPTQG